jgi:hypothetical protein
MHCTTPDPNGGKKMRLRKNDPDPQPAAGPGESLADKLSQVRPIFHDEDERQSAADRGTYHSPLKSLFEPVDYPRWLKPRKSKKRF